MRNPCSSKITIPKPSVKPGTAASWEALAVVTLIFLLQASRIQRLKTITLHGASLFAIRWSSLVMSVFTTRR